MVAGEVRKHQSLPCAAKQREKIKIKEQTKYKQHPELLAGMGAPASRSHRPLRHPRRAAAPTGTCHCVSINPAVPDLPQKPVQRAILKIKQKRKNRKAREVGVGLLSCFPSISAPKRLSNPGGCRLSAHFPAVCLSAGPGWRGTQFSLVPTSPLQV